MATFRSFDAAGKAHGDLAKALRSGSALSALEREVGSTAQEIASRAARSDLGSDGAFSGWRHRKPIPLDTRIERPNSGDPGVVILPTRMTAGLWTVAESGRKAYAKGDRRKSGTRTRKKDGVVVDKFRVVKGTVTATKGHATATDAVADMKREVPAVIRRGLFDAINKYLQ